MMTFLIKGLLRDRSRSLFPIIMVSAGVFLSVLLYSFIKGAIGGMVETSAKFESGHVKVTTRAYDVLSEQVPNDLALLGVGALLDDLKETYPRMTWTARIEFGGLLDIPDEAGETRAQGPVFGMGIDLLNPQSLETAILNLKKSIVRGRLPAHPDEILISDTFARKLGLKVGQPATLISVTMNGAMAVHNFKVAGTVLFGMAALDKHTIVADLQDVRRALDMADGAGEVLGFSSDMIYDDTHMKEMAKTFNARASNPADEFSPIMVALAQRGLLSEMLQMANGAGAIMVAVFMFAMAIVLWNAGLMNGIRRYGEVGVRLAMGEPKGRIYRAMIFESIVIGIIGSIAGTILGLALSYWMQYHGFDFGSMMQKATILTSNVVRAQVTVVSYYIGFFPGVLASMLGTLFAGIGIYRRQTSQLFRELEA
jgi:putative ABC transport system permease protein